MPREAFVGGCSSRLAGTLVRMVSSPHMNARFASRLPLGRTPLVACKNSLMVPIAAGTAPHVPIQDILPKDNADVVRVCGNQHTRSTASTE